MREYVRCRDCEAGVNLDTGQPCRTCQGAGGWWLEIEVEDGFRISWEPHEDPEPP